MWQSEWLLGYVERSGWSHRIISRRRKRVGQAGIGFDVLGFVYLFFDPLESLLQLILLAHSLAQLAEGVLELALVHEFLEDLGGYFPCCWGLSDRHWRLVFCFLLILDALVDLHGLGLLLLLDLDFFPDLRDLALVEVLHLSDLALLVKLQLSNSLVHHLHLFLQARVVLTLALVQLAV